MMLARLSNLAAARVSGHDAVAFLQAQLSADIAALAPGDAGFACYCSPRGQVLGLLLVCRRSGDFVIVSSGALLPGILQRLRMFVLRARVEMALEPGWIVCGVQEPGDVRAPASAWHAGATGLSYVVLEEETPAASAPGEAGHDGARAGWRHRELEAGVSWLYPETAERFIPQMLGFDRIGAVSFSKGCYPGQEIVARARYLGKVKRKPLPVRVHGRFAPEPGAAAAVLRSGEWSDVTVIDSAPGPHDATLVLTVAAELEGAPPQALRYLERDYQV